MFSTDIWGQEVEHNNDTTWLRENKKYNEWEEQTQVQILQEELKKMLKKILDWKVPRPDGVQGFWLKNRLT